MAWGRIQGEVRPLSCEDLDTAALPAWGGDRVVLAREDQQFSGSFRARGAMSWLQVARTEGELTEAGIAVAAQTQASAAAWAWAATTENVPATLFVAPTLSTTLRALGARVTVVADDAPVERRDAHGAATGAMCPDPHDQLLAAAAGTWVLELNACVDVATVLIPVWPSDDGGLLAGTIAAAVAVGVKVVLVALPDAPIPNVVRNVLSGRSRFPGPPEGGPGVRLELVRVTAADVSAAATTLARRGRVVTEEGALPLAALTTVAREPRRCYAPGRGEPVAVLLAGPPSGTDQQDRSTPCGLRPYSLVGTDA